ncbi:ATP-dependent RNA helicase RhlE [Filimonas sp.]|nr:ATP-dependent RNA helicase RhlE [Filimonas sp.]
MDKAHIEHTISFIQYKNSTSLSEIKPCPMRSSSLPGVATRMSTPFLKASTWDCCPTPPKMTVQFKEVYLP